ncbi:hypothetical protein WN943_005813 [Citrus x changshan-huyou]
MTSSLEDKTHGLSCQSGYVLNFYRYSDQAHTIRIRTLEVHPRSTLAALLFANFTGGDNIKHRAAYTREGGKQLFAVLQSAMGSSGKTLIHGLIWNFSRPSNSSTVPGASSEGVNSKSFFYRPSV